MAPGPLVWSPSNYEKEMWRRQNQDHPLEKKKGRWRDDDDDQRKEVGKEEKRRVVAEVGFGFGP